METITHFMELLLLSEAWLLCLIANWHEEIWFLNIDLWLRMQTQLSFQTQWCVSSLGKLWSLQLIITIITLFMSRTQSWTRIAILITVLLLILLSSWQLKEQMGNLTAFCLDLRLKNQEITFLKIILTQRTTSSLLLQVTPQDARLKTPLYNLSQLEILQDMEEVRLTMLSRILILGLSLLF